MMKIVTLGRTLCITTALLIVVVVVGCNAPQKQQQKAASSEASQKSAPSAEARPPAAESATPASAGFQLDAIATNELDEIVGRIGAREEGRMLASTIDVLSEGHSRPNRSARLTGTVGGFSASGQAGSGKSACKVSAFSAEQINVEANGDGSNAKIVSSLSGTAAKVYCDLTLPRSKTTIPNGSVLRRDDKGWKTINEPTTEARLDEISRGSRNKATALGLSSH